jgi:hypothetical protein
MRGKSPCRGWDGTGHHAKWYAYITAQDRLSLGFANLTGIFTYSCSGVQLLACALGCATSDFVPLDEIPEDLDRIPGPPPTDANIELAEAYFHAAKQRFGSLHTSPTDISCFLLAGSYHRHAMRPLQAWFCFQQASCRLEVRLRSLCRKQWTADANYHNLESRLYWSCIQAEQ